ncbi:MAG: hypothetical protein BMS9Abin34_528 [Patescibacteria group bacterium]|nr:MAG: hypothetical protein BMS9Abin34_528 [Patescibacteria group bacterium]
MSKFFIVLVVTAGMLMAGCAGDSASPIEVPASPTEASSPVEPTSMPTTVPTPTLDPTAVPTEVPTQVSTEEPTPTPEPTEVPMYVGLPAEEVAKLREQCLQDNPGSLCLPLPVNPNKVGTIQDEGMPFPGPWELREFNIVAELPPGSRILSPLDGQMRVYGIAFQGWYPLERGSRGSLLVSFQWGPFRRDPSGFHGSYAPTVALSLSYNPPGGYAPEDVSISDSLKIFGGRRDVVAGEPLAEVVGETPVYLRISWYPVAEVVEEEGAPDWADPMELFLSRMSLDLLLRNDAGSIVYALPLGG